MSVAVLDAWAVLAFLRKEGSAAATVRRYLRRAESGNLRLLLTLINLGEVFYRSLQTAGPDKAETALQLLKGLPIDMLPVKEGLVLEAARLKGAHPLSYADAFAVAAARLHEAPVLTGDPEILSLPRSIVRVRALYR